MPKSSVDLKKVAQDLAKATRQLNKDKDAERLAVGQLQRRKIQLEAVNKDLERKQATATSELKKLMDDIEIERLRKDDITGRNNELEIQNAELENTLKANTKELAELTAELETKKASLDSELEQYALVRKREIKDKILNANAKLTEVSEELEQRNSELQSKKNELGELNQVYLDEQAALKISNADTEAKLAANRELVATTEENIEALRRQLKELEYTKDGVMVRLAKAKEEHEKFLDYEKRARKALDIKDRELQNRAGDIATESQFLKNQRSFLPEM